MPFPIHRQRRLRELAAARDLVRETQLSASDFIYPIFVVEGSNQRQEIASMPGQYRLSVDALADEARTVFDCGVKSMIVFGLPDHKDATGSAAWAEDGVVQKAMRTIKETVPQMMIIGDVCFCQYTDHGHCGVIHNNTVDNDATLPNLAKVALSQVHAGRRYDCPIGYDGWPRWRHSQTPRRERQEPHSNYVLRCQVCFVVLRPVS